MLIWEKMYYWLPQSVKKNPLSKDALNDSHDQHSIYKLVV